MPKCVQASKKEPRGAQALLEKARQSCEASADDLCAFIKENWSLKAGVSPPAGRQNGEFEDL